MGRQNTIIRIRKRRTRFVMIDKSFLANARLGLDAMGLLAWLMSKPDDWTIIQSAIASSTGTSGYKVRQAMQRLDDAGYVRRHPVRDLRSGKIVRWQFNVFETPELASDTDGQQMSLFERVEPKPARRARNPRFSRNTPEVEKPASGSPAAGRPCDGSPAAGLLSLRMNETEQRSLQINDDERAPHNVCAGTAVQPPTAVGSDAVVVALEKVGFDAGDARGLVSRFGVGQLSQALRCLETAPTPPGNPRGYVVQAAMQRWTPRTAVPAVSRAEAVARAALELNRKRRADKEAIA